MAGESKDIGGEGFSALIKLGLRLSDVLLNVVVGIGQVVGSLVAGAFDGVKEALSTLGQSFENTGRSIGRLLKWGEKLINRLFNKETIEPVNETAEAVERVSNRFEKLGKPFEMLGTVIGGSLGIIAKGVEGISRFVDSLLSGLERVGGPLLDQVAGSLEGLGKIFGTIAGWLGGIKDAFASIFGGKTKESVDGVTTAIDGVNESLSPL
jgi:hypothetical protein